MKFKEFVLAFGFVWLVAAYIAIFYTFITAYLDPLKMATISINGYGEADVEMVLLLLGLPCVFLFIKRSLIINKK